MQDFANVRKDSSIHSNQEVWLEWSPDIPSFVMGVLLGAFLAVLGFKVADYRMNQSMTLEPVTVEEIKEKPFVFEFYDALKVYEVSPKFNRMKKQ